MRCQVTFPYSSGKTAPAFGRADNGGDFPDNPLAFQRPPVTAVVAGVAVVTEDIVFVLAQFQRLFNTILGIARRRRNHRLFDIARRFALGVLGQWLAVAIDDAHRNRFAAFESSSLFYLDSIAWQAD